MDLFHHEMLKSSLFRCFCIPLDRLQLFLNLVSVQIIKCNLSFSYAGHLKISDVIHISCIFQNSRNIRCDVRILTIYTKYHRAVFSCHINLSRIILKHHCQCIRTTNTDQCMIDCINRCTKIFLIIIVN